MNRLPWTECGLCLCLAACQGEQHAREASLRDELEILRAEAGVPGISAAFVTADGTFGSVAVGVTDPNSDRPLQPGDRMLAASIGKSFVAATALCLAAEGRLNLDAPVADHLGSCPWFSRLPAHGDLRIRHLINHSSGLPDHVHLPAFQQAMRERHPNDPPFTCSELITFLLDQPSRFPPGTGWAYSDTNYVLLGMILESVTGQDLYREVENRFLIPLALEDTLPSNARMLPGLVPGVAADNPLGIPRDSHDAEGRLRWHPGVERWGGGWMSTAGDLARWGDALFNGAALPRAIRPELRRTVPTGPGPDAPRYGAGVAFYPQGPNGLSWGHGGWIPGYVSSLRYYPDHQLTVAIQINTDDPEGTLGEDWLPVLESRVTRTLIHHDR
jgi:D-alanyl-D-alanine carboxypeptidase